MKLVQIKRVQSTVYLDENMQVCMLYVIYNALYREVICSNANFQNKIIYPSSISWWMYSSRHENNSCEALSNNTRWNSDKILVNGFTKPEFTESSVTGTVQKYTPFRIQSDNTPVSLQNRYKFSLQKSTAILQTQLHALVVHCG
jgi:hypothetical protein